MRRWVTTSRNHPACLFPAAQTTSQPKHASIVNRFHQIKAPPRIVRALGICACLSFACADRQSSATLKHACPKGVYVAPIPDAPLFWSGVVFVQKGPYANAILRFQIDFGEDYPERPPIVSFLSDVFHPLVTPLTTYTYSTRDSSAETVSAADRDRLPPGGLNLRHGFPEWFGQDRNGIENIDSLKAQDDSEARLQSRSLPLTVEVLQYLRIVLDTEAMLDSVPLEAAANVGAWHAWRTYRSKSLGGRSSPAPNVQSNTSDAIRERSSSPRQQPGGARRPGEWNWQGVWEDRVKKVIQASISEHALYSSDNSDVISFSKVDESVAREMMPVTQGSGG